VPRLPLGLLLITVLYVAALHVVMPAEPRFNVPVMPVLFAAGAAGAAMLVRAGVLSRKFALRWPRSYDSGHERRIGNPAAPSACLTSGMR
jgi:hypothetical protein